MIDEQKIRFYLDTFKTLRAEDLHALIGLASSRTLQPGETYVRAGTLHRKIAYVVEGLIRSYTYKSNGDEATIQLFWEDQFFASRHSVLFHQPSPFIYEAIEPTTLLEIDFEKMEELLNSQIRYAPSRNFFLTHMLAQSMERVESFILLTPEERYLQLVAEKPNIINRVPDKYIATLLGITPVSLSRIRRRIASRR